MRRILFLCDRPLGTQCFEFLISRNYRLCAVVSKDREEINWWGRSNVRDLCEDRRIPWYPLSTDLSKVVDETSPDVILSVLYPKIVPKNLVETHACFNLHCASLPEYGGWNSTLWAILNGEKTFGATLHEMSERADEGAIIRKGSFQIPPNVTNVELYQWSHENGFKIFCEEVSRLVTGDYSTTPSDGIRRYYRPKDLPSREVNPYWRKEKIATYARAFYFPPFEPAYFVISGQKIWLIPERQGKEREGKIKLEETSVEFFRGR